jgi:hypothetical protein
MYKLLKPTLLFLLLFAALFSCEKWENEPADETVAFISCVKNDEGGIVDEYEYRKNMLIKSCHVEPFFMSEKKAEYEYKYNDDKQLVEKTGFEPGNMIMSSIHGASDKNISCSYEYNGEGKLVKSLIDYEYLTFDEINHSAVYEYSYPDGNTILEKVSAAQHSTGGSLIEYRFSNDGNIIEILTYSTIDDEKGELLSKDKMEYDNKPAPFNCSPRPKSKNNMVRKLSYYGSQSAQDEENPSIFEYEYTYNKNNYPETLIETWPNGQIFKRTFYYIK